MNRTGRRESCEYLELHVFFVPLELWNSKLNTVSSEAIGNFISAGLIRVYPHITLQSLRDELSVLLGEDALVDRYSFLKCVGRSLALVKTKQEKELRVKSFSPPYPMCGSSSSTQAPHPELYLLPSYVDPSGSSSRSPSHTSGLHSCSTQPLPSLRSDDLNTTTNASTTATHPKQPTQTLPLHFPEIIAQTSRQTAAPSLDDNDEDDDEDEEEEYEEDSFISLEAKEEVYSSKCGRWGEEHRQREKASVLSRTHQEPGVMSKETPLKATLCSGERAQVERVQTQGLEGVGPCLEGAGPHNDADSGLSLSTHRNYRDARNNRIKCGMESSQTRTPAYTVTARKPVASDFSTNRRALQQEVGVVRDERKQLERSRQELLRKGKDLLALNRHRRNQARDAWKRRYFETKKATAPLEESLKKARQELEAFYTKLLQQLHARDGRSKHKRLGKINRVKNDLIIQIMAEISEIDDLRRKVEDCKIRLEAEQKLRLQAAAELHTLRAELASKRSEPLATIHAPGIPASMQRSKKSTGGQHPQ